MRLASTITTAEALLTAVGPFGPSVDREELDFAVDPPSELVPVIEVLQTGLRALLGGRPWYGCDGETGRVVQLQPGVPVPGNVTLLCVAGDTCWDRIGPGVKNDLPALFALTPRRR
jgi:hypothetical protein